MKLAPVLIVLALTTGCGNSQPPLAANRPRAGTPQPVNPPAGNFTLYVSNQSFERPTVDVSVSIDGKQLVAQDFEVKGQHNWIAFGRDLSTGKHELRAVSNDGGARLTKIFTTGARNWVVLDYWCCDPSQQEPRFTFQLSDRPVAFA